MASVQETFITLKLKVYYTLNRDQGVNVSAHLYSEHKTCLSNTFEIYISSRPSARPKSLRALLASIKAEFKAYIVDGPLEPKWKTNLPHAQCVQPLNLELSLLCLPQ